MTKVTDLYSEVLKNPKYSPKNSWKWYNDQITTLMRQKGINTYDVLAQDVKRQTNKLQVGHMYCFFYSPIHKETLPHYDTFPLVFPFSVQDGYMTGLNLHYLNPRMRLALMDKLMKFSNDQKTDSKTRLLLSWKLLSNAAKFPEVSHCVKKYHIGHIKSVFMDVNPKFWLISALLPVEKFKGASSEEVWALSTVATPKKGK